MNDPLLISRAPPPSPPSRLPMLLTIVVALIFVLVLPYLAEEVNYGLKRGEMRAQADAAAAELAKLGKNVELVGISDTSRAFRLVAQRVEPSVVHINTEAVRVVRQDMQDEWGFRVPRGRGERLRGQGSGVVVDAAKGYVVTNYHVIQDASALNVQLADGRQIEAVTIVGYDVLTDIAVLQIKADKLIAADWGDSEQLEVGDWVLAVGNPYGLDRTVTSGIVSAKQRRVHARDSSPYQDFLQTDAAVNPGNSGGPLVNIRGEVIGITTAIVGQSFQGISFAIPSGAARDIYNRLIAEGKVARAWLGVGFGTLNTDEAKEIGLKAAGAVIITRVVPGSPAAEAGLRPGDVVLKWQGDPVVDAMELTLQIGKEPIGSKVKVTVLRDQQQLDVTVTLGQRPDELELRR
jgi:S1-C subfamily serine protease